MGVGMTDDDLTVLAFAALVVWLVYKEPPEIEQGKQVHPKGSALSVEGVTNMLGERGAQIGGACCCK
jgi:hypothetical protein